jgi:hypothetical protein
MHEYERAAQTEDRVFAPYRALSLAKNSPAAVQLALNRDPDALHQ